MQSVTDTVQMFAVRKIGKNVPHTKFTYFDEEAMNWMEEGDELVIVHIKPVAAIEGGIDRPIKEILF